MHGMRKVRAVSDLEDLRKYGLLGVTEISGFSSTLFLLILAYYVPD